MEKVSGRRGRGKVPDKVGEGFGCKNAELPNKFWHIEVVPCNNRLASFRDV